MIKHIVKIQSVETINHDVLRVVTDRPSGYAFSPGQATEIAIHKYRWKDERRPFTFTSLPDRDTLEFIIKTYPAHKGVTNELLKVEKDDELILHEVFGAIKYQHEGLFIAGGAGITPFISILRDLQQKGELGANKLIFANKTKKDIILADEFEALLGENFINILSAEKSDKHAFGMITASFLKDYLNNSVRNIYLCGPPAMMDALDNELSSLGIDTNVIIKEAV